MGWSLSGKRKSSLFVGCDFCFKGNEWLLKEVPTQYACEKCDNKGGHDEEAVFGVARKMELFKGCHNQGVDPVGFEPSVGLVKGELSAIQLI